MGRITNLFPKIKKLYKSVNSTCKCNFTADGKVGFRMVFGRAAALALTPALSQREREFPVIRGRGRLSVLALSLWERVG